VLNGERLGRGAGEIEIEPAADAYDPEAGRGFDRGARFLILDADVTDLSIENVFIESPTGLRVVSVRSITLKNVEI
jgi:hypothetical protein